MARTEVKRTPSPVEQFRDYARQISLGTDEQEYIAQLFEEAERKAALLMRDRCVAAALARVTEETEDVATRIQNHEAAAIAAAIQELEP